MNDELSRVLSNPENIIMSDSLKGILDLEEETPQKSSFETCTIEFNNDKISGQLKKFIWSDQDSKLRVNFSCDQSIFTEFLGMKGKNISIAISKFSYSGKVVCISLERSLSTNVEITIDQ